MPLEYRLIQLREGELEEAVDRWLRSTGELGQYGRTGNFQLLEEGKKVSLVAECWDIQTRHKKNRRTVSIGHEDLRQAIVLYCKDHKIPLAQSGKKVVRMLDGRVAMYYALT